MAGIFYFSSRPDPLPFLPSKGHRNVINRAAHFSEYAVLYLLLHRVLREQGSGGDGETNHVSRITSTR
jgi:hypothetical protein